MSFQIDKKFKSNRSFKWDGDGHRLNLYINAYLNVPVRVDKFKDYIAAGLETLAAELRAEAARDRGRYLQETVEAEAIPAELRLDEEKEVLRDEKLADRNEKVKGGQ